MGGGFGVLVQYVCACVTTVFGYEHRIYFYLHTTTFIPAHLLRMETPHIYST